MCFTPSVSISIATIEFVLATILICSFKKTPLRNFSALLIYVLGFYQFTEFMLCTSNNPILWARLGFITYTFLPAISLNMGLGFLNKKSNYFILYIIPVLATAYALYFPVVLSASCTTVFVQVQTLFNHSGPLLNSILFSLYDLYYALFIIANAFLFYIDFKNTKNRTRRKLDLTIITGIILMTLPTLLFITIFPYLGVRFPSVLCFFAIFVAITSFIAVYLENRIEKK